ncbi:MAG TPA: GRP family sugar transporter [Terriglobales bacterium]
MATAQSNPSSTAVAAPAKSRAARLQALGILCGFAAGAWLGAAEAPTKLVTIGVSPVVVSFMMVLGVFLARWTVPSLFQGVSGIRADVKQAPHLIIWGVLAGCIWAVANTLTIFAIRDIGLSIAFPLWNSNSLLGILWGFLLFNELRGAGARRWFGVVGGAFVMFVGALLLALVSSTQAPGGQAIRGVIGAVGAGALWGTMYIPYRKAYLTGMSPLSFVAFFTIGELGMMSILGVTYSGGVQPFWAQLSSSKNVLFWLLLGGFIWVVGDIFQQYAAKYVGISRGIPLSNTNQLWGLLWGILVFGELRGASHQNQFHVVVGSLLMAAGAGAIALSSAKANEQSRWREAAERETQRYGLDSEYVQSRFMGEQPAYKRTWVDFALIAIAVAVIVFFAREAQVPQIQPHWGTMAVLVIAMLVLAIPAVLGLWKTSRTD